MSDNNISYEETHKQQIDSGVRHVGVAQEPQNIVRTQRNIAQPDDEYLVRIKPHVEVVFGAVLNSVNEVVEQHKTYVPGQYAAFDQSQQLGEQVSLHRPISVAANGAARAPLTSLYEALAALELQTYLVLGNANQQQERVAKLVATLHKQLQNSFGGDDFEELGQDYAIARSDYFSTSVTQYESVDEETVNTIHLVVRINIHASSLTSTSEDPGEAIKVFDTQYRQVIKSFASASDIPTQIAVAFDVSNFNVRPNLLVLFSALCTEPGAEASAVNADEHPDANVMVSVALKNPNAIAKAAPKAGKPKPKKR